MPMLHSRPILAFKSLIPLSSILYLLPLPPYYRLLLLAALLRLLLPLPPLTLSEFFNRMLAVSEPGALNCHTFFRAISLILFVSRNSILTHLPLSGSLNSLLCDLIVPTPGLAFSFVMPRTLAAASSFSSSRAYYFLNFLPPLSLFACPYSVYVGVNITLNNSSSLSFLNVYAPPIRSSYTDDRTNFFSPPFFPPPEIFSFWEILTTFWDSRDTSDPRGEEVFNCVISFDLLAFNDSDIPALLHRLSCSRSFPDISFAPFLSPFFAPGRCFRIWVLITYQFFYLSLFLRSFAPTNVPLP